MERRSRPSLPLPRWTRSRKRPWEKNKSSDKKSASKREEGNKGQTS
ncbi:hypothetical protein LEMLEM_LOCUS10083 [Lemmus lemmus]